MIYLGMGVGSVIGSYIPLLWGDSMFSLTSVILGAVGGFAGIYVGYQLAN